MPKLSDKNLVELIDLQLRMQASTQGGKKAKGVKKGGKK